MRSAVAALLPSQLHTAGGHGRPPPPQLASHHASVAVGTSDLQPEPAAAPAAPAAAPVGAAAAAAAPCVAARPTGGAPAGVPAGQVHVSCGHRPAAQLATHHAARSASPLTLVQPPPGTPLGLRAPPLASAVTFAEG